jgi:hypothetical protein
MASMKKIATIAAALVLAGCAGSVDVELGGWFSVADAAGTRLYTASGDGLECRAGADMDDTPFLRVEFHPLDGDAPGYLRFTVGGYAPGSNVYGPPHSVVNEGETIHRGWDAEWRPLGTDGPPYLTSGSTGDCQLRLDAGEEIVTGRFRCAPMAGWEEAGEVSISDGGFACVPARNAAP